MLSPPLVTWLDLITASPARANCIKLVKLTEAPREERSAPPLLLLLVSPLLQPGIRPGCGVPSETEKTGSRELFGGFFFPPFCEGNVRFCSGTTGPPCWGLQAWETAGVFQLFRVGPLMADNTIHATTEITFFFSTALKKITQPS